MNSRECKKRTKQPRCRGPPVKTYCEGVGNTAVWSDAGLGQWGLDVNRVAPNVSHVSERRGTVMSWTGPLRTRKVTPKQTLHFRAAVTIKANVESRCDGVLYHATCGMQKYFMNKDITY